ncbi:TetR/AcrR family transcriptional regulator [Amycolatopsis sp. H20-H5]|uniref:TetR/AcrR family transcriptional regulator n=1 Tax=Amycolatopsis sp. H20-H5 TaxID=3046309 RepID=UPI002DBF65A0|nr:TetR/AcrR family transcriptional regulator [Amycolatopsis sp. H20-H5]MEC3973860.1 TetR/AcrR family transcriptional regulator [Amycolatopsis sp. H20-H5]
MPKVVDREERRRAIASALLRLAAREGLEAVSIRTVAAENDMSPGAVQKYFATKEDIILRALELTEERLESRYAALPPNAGIGEHLRQYLPLDDKRREEAILLTAFTARAANRADWAKFLEEGYTAIHDSTAELLRQAQRDGLLPADRDAHDLAAGLIALSDGLTLRLLLLPPGAPEADRLLRALDTSVRALLG